MKQQRNSWLYRVSEESVKELDSLAQSLGTSRTKLMPLVMAQGMAALRTVGKPRNPDQGMAWQENWRPSEGYDSGPNCRRCWGDGYPECRCEKEQNPDHPPAKHADVSPTFLADLETEWRLSDEREEKWFAENAPLSPLSNPTTQNAPVETITGDPELDALLEAFGQ